MRQLPGDKRSRLGVDALPEVENGGLELGQPLGDSAGGFAVAERRKDGGLSSARRCQASCSTAATRAATVAASPGVSGPNS
ncbi:hypothetical protein [Peterkaempfera sp. SMS 1(5)a]|uniref:hypothetical protein n=1 Tax=Peterkaempfera podocarpi TaxID=3232308 RepID=UPI00366C0C7A